MKTLYDQSVVPPAPSIEIWLGAPDEALTLGPFPALVDTGADICVIPSQLLAPLKLAADDERFLRALGGTRRPVQIYTIDLGIGPMRLPSVDVAADDSESEIILGRNVLNKLFILLDGPHQLLEVRET